MRAGRLKHTVTLQRPTTGRDGMGGASTVYTDMVPPVRAGIEPLRGREWFEAQRSNTEIQLRIVMRYRADVTEQWRVVHDGAAYEVVGLPIDPDLKRRELHLMCRRIK